MWTVNLSQIPSYIQNTNRLNIDISRSLMEKNCQDQSANDTSVPAQLVQPAPLVQPGRGVQPGLGVQPGHIVQPGHTVQPGPHVQSAPLVQPAHPTGTPIEIPSKRTIADRTPPYVPTNVKKTITKPTTRSQIIKTKNKNLNPNTSSFKLTLNLVFQIGL
ncbi:hypothetical protein G6F61_013430 [Rhizopus arrhizus]|nr:hypothetical protein G6F61_013430 [Rhizopus arrhizus]